MNKQTKERQSENKRKKKNTASALTNERKKDRRNENKKNKENV